MNRNKHLLLWSSLAALGLLVWAAVEENLRRQWRTIQAEVHGASGPIETRLRQVVAPKLKATDRCVTCHVGMAPGEQDLAGGPLAAPHPAVGHDPAEFGCTVCHGGQGRATDKDDAHGTVHFWPDPMIPRPYVEAGCGSCHTHIRVPNLVELARGRNLLERSDCLACHRLDGRGATIRPGAAGGMEGPDLSRVGAAGFDHQWYAKHLDRASAARDGAWKQSFGPLTDEDREAIERFLASRIGAPKLAEAKSAFHSLGCRGCHKVGGVGGSDGPDLTLVGRKDPGRLDFGHVPGQPTLANWLSEHTRAPAKIVPGSAMPAMGLADEQVELLTLYMLSLRRGELPEAYWPKDRVRSERFGEREFATDGATLFGTFCSACHGVDARGRRYPGTPPFPAVGNADFLAVATDAFLMETIRRGRPGRRMAAWGETDGGLRDEEIAAVIGHLRRQSGAAAPKPKHSQARWIQADAAAGKRLYTAYCAGCHGPEGEGSEAPALNNPVLLETASDEYLVETIGRGRSGTAMNGFRRPSTVYPAIAEGDIESIVAHLRTLGKRAKP